LTYNDGTAATIRIKGDAGIDSNNDGSVDKPDYPTGYRPFYCYKYELTEQQYADFLNCLTPAQRSNLGVAGAGITLANGEYFSSAPNRACGNMTAQRMLAYADWSGLRPMTILEMNKASYGPLQPFQTETNFFAAGGANSPFYNNNNNTFGPLLDVGFYDSGTTTRSQSGSSYYGIDDLTGNAREQVVSLNFLNFNSVNGDGVLDASGNANVNGWSNTGMLIGYDQFAGANYSAPYIGTRLVRSAE
jgi:formylglycine-generating enzyme required for sulfatase activity